jgi:hypothetical protein
LTPVALLFPIPVGVPRSTIGPAGAVQMKACCSPDAVSAQPTTKFAPFALLLIATAALWVPPNPQPASMSTRVRVAKS